MEENKVEEKKNNKWRAIAVCEAVIICLVLVIVALFVLKKNDSRVVSGDVTESAVTEEVMETREVVNIKGEETNAVETTAGEETKQPSTGQEITTPATTPAATLANLQKNDGKVAVGFETKANWESGDSQYEQYSLLIENKLENEILGWEYRIAIPEGVEIGQFWGCNIATTDGAAVVTPLEYTAKIPVGEGLPNDVGITVQWKKDEKFDIASGQFSYTTSLEEETSMAEETKEQATTAEQNETTQAVTEKTYAAPETGTPVGNHGKLSVQGTDLVDEGGSKYQLKGVSTHGLAWFPAYVNKDSFKTLRDDYNANTVRLALYTYENGGYCAGGDKAALKKLVEDGVSYATDLGMYVIIDWHVLNDNNPNRFKNEAIQFFGEMSKKYASYENVIYEICNEPCGGTSWADIKSYATDVIKEIRKNDDDAVILVGTPNWSQEVDKAAADRIENDKNVMYTLHFYAATHKDDLRNKLIAAHKAGLPIFISEFSICDASGNGGIDYDSAKKWISLIDDYNLSYVTWSLCNKAETSALLKSSCTRTSGYTKDDLSDAGKWILETFK